MGHKAPKNKSSFLLTDGALAEWVASQKRFYESKELLGSKTFLAYGTMETSSAATTNLPDPEKTHPRDQVQFLSRTGSVGKLMPGQAAQIRHPVTGEIGSLFETGMLWLKGVNIFEGYFDQPEKTAEVLREGWFRTGELGRFDEEGFLFLEGQPQSAAIQEFGSEGVGHHRLTQPGNLTSQSPREISRLYKSVVPNS